MSSVVTAKFLIVRGVNPGARTPINVTVIDSAMTALGHEHACAAATSVVRSRTHSCHSRHATLPLLPFGAVQRLAARRQLSRNHSIARSGPQVRSISNLSLPG